MKNKKKHLSDDEIYESALEKLMDENDDVLFTKEEEELFREYYLRSLVKRYPNPQRIGCPDADIVRDIAFRRKVDPATLRKVTSHIWKCAECILDMLGYAEEYKKTRKTRNKKTKRADCNEET